MTDVWIEDADDDADELPPEEEHGPDGEAAE